MFSQDEPNNLHPKRCYFLRNLLPFHVEYKEGNCIKGGSLGDPKNLRGRGSTDPNIRGQGFPHGGEWRATGG